MYISSRIRRKFYQFNRFSLGFIYVFHTAFKSILIINIRRISYAIYNGNFVALSLISSSHSCKETALLLFKLHGINVFYFY